MILLGNIIYDVIRELYSFVSKNYDRKVATLGLSIQEPCLHFIL